MKMTLIRLYQTLSGWSQNLVNLSKINYKVKCFHNLLPLKMSSKDR